MADDVIFVDNSGLFKSELRAALLRALERCGQEGEKIAKQLAPSPGKFGHGALRNSINHKVDPSELAVQIGTNMEYALYLEVGTGIYTPGGRQTPWAYKDEEGNWHHTRGQEAKPYLKPAVADHKQTYRNIFEDEMKKR